MIALYEFKRCCHSLPVLEEDDFANIREADVAVKQSFASGGQVSRSLLSPWSLRLGVPKAREFLQRGPSALQSSVVLAVVLIAWYIGSVLVRYRATHTSLPPSSSPPSSSIDCRRQVTAVVK